MILSSRFERAFEYACVLHSGQVRKGTDIPYVAHLLSVAALVLEHGGDEDETIAALLHDAVEDAGGKPRSADIRARFGDRVAEIVEGCTDADVIPKPPWQERKERYIEHLATAPASVLLVSCCDKLHNARSIVADLREHGEPIFERFNGRKEGTLWYYRELARTFERRGAPRRLVDELNRTTREMHELAGAADPPGAD